MIKTNLFFLVKVKWGREVYPEIDVNTDEEPILFKAQLFALTGVQPERQKIMCKGGILKDDEWNLQLKDVSFIFAETTFINNNIPLTGSRGLIIRLQGKSTRGASNPSKIH